MKLLRTHTSLYFTVYASCAMKIERNAITTHIASEGFELFSDTILHASHKYIRHIASRPFGPTFIPYQPHHAGPQ